MQQRVKQEYRFCQRNILYRKETFSWSKSLCRYSLLERLTINNTTGINNRMNQSRLLNNTGTGWISRIRKTAGWIACPRKSERLTSWGFWTYEAFFSAMICSVTKEKRHSNNTFRSFILLLYSILKRWTHNL